MGVSVRVQQFGKCSIPGLVFSDQFAQCLQGFWVGFNTVSGMIEQQYLF